VSKAEDLDQGLAAEKEGFVRSFLSEDAREGISAFVQKRQAKFQGK
jgi:enoyl-CoA hydratase/carnithine racemase